MAHDAGALAGLIEGGRRYIAAEFDVDEGVVSAGIEEKRSRMSVHFGVHEDQRMHRAKGEENQLGITKTGGGEERKGHQDCGQSAKTKSERQVQNTHQLGPLSLHQSNATGTTRRNLSGSGIQNLHERTAARLSLKADPSVPAKRAERTTHASGCGRPQPRGRDDNWVVLRNARKSSIVLAHFPLAVRVRFDRRQKKTGQSGCAFTKTI